MNMRLHHPDLSPLPGDDLDRLLSAFYKSELPHPFPNLTPPLALRRIAPPPPAQRSLVRGRLALAASVAVLVGACWLVSGRFAAPIHQPHSLDNGTASPRQLHLTIQGEQPMVDPVEPRFVDPFGTDAQWQKP